jgi:hypothetical protein
MTCLTALFDELSWQPDAAVAADVEAFPTPTATSAASAASAATSGTPLRKRCIPSPSVEDPTGSQTGPTATL